jgi:arsenate reductase (glutaredoxin)
MSGHCDASQYIQDRADAWRMTVTSCNLKTARTQTSLFRVFPRNIGNTYNYPFDLHQRGSDPLSVTMFGIKNCDTIKKARAWLDTHDVAYDFHDYKTAGIDRARLERWCKELGWEVLLNRAGTTFRKLPDTDKAVSDSRKAIALMLAQPSMIKRPVLDLGGRLLVGFKPELYQDAVRTRRK